jgi:predicted metalloenzyme YecM
MVSWCRRKQTHVALSTAKAEYIALCVEVCDAVRLRKLLADLFGHEMDSTVINCNNQSCVKLFENPVFNDKSKHIEIWCRGKQYMCNTFLHMSMLQMSLPNRLPGQSSSTSVRDLAWWRMPP